MVRIDRWLAVLMAGLVVATMLAIAGTVILVEIAGAELLPAHLLNGRRQVTDSAIILATRPAATPTATAPARPTVTPEPPHLTPVATEPVEQAPKEPAPQAEVAVSQGTLEPDPLDDVERSTPDLPATPTEAATTTETPPTVPDRGDSPPDAPIPTGTPDATPSALPTEPINPPAADLPPSTSGSGFDDLADFADYLRARRTTVGGQPFEILALTMAEDEGSAQRFALAVAADEGADVFAAQPPEELWTFGLSLLDDVKRYMGNTACEITVESTYAVTSTDACIAAPDWCTVNAPQAIDDPTTVTWTYLRGRYVGGADTLETWNAHAQVEP